MYIPQALPIIVETTACRTDVECVEEVRLALPSEINPARRETVCPERLIAMEARLREAQCRDALQDLRIQLHTIDHLQKYKRKNVRHQGPNTRTRSEISKYENRKLRAVNKYRRARRAKLALSGSGDWEREFQLLRDDDVRGLEDDDPAAVAQRAKRRRDQSKVGPAEGRRQLSWIWRSSDCTNNSGMIDSLRVEWLKARARVMRWAEECKLIPEEMRRVLASHAYEENAWFSRATVRSDVNHRLQEGLVAYAIDQANIRRAMRRKFRAVCVEVVQASEATSLGNEWQEVDGPEVDLESSSLEDEAAYELDGEDLEPEQYA